MFPLEIPKLSSFFLCKQRNHRSNGLVKDLPQDIDYILSVCKVSFFLPRDSLRREETFPEGKPADFWSDLSQNWVSGSALVVEADRNPNFCTRFRTSSRFFEPPLSRDRKAKLKTVHLHRRDNLPS